MRGEAGGVCCGSRAILALLRWLLGYCYASLIRCTCWSWRGLRSMQKTPKRNKQPLPCGEPASLPPDKRKRESPEDFVALLPPEVSLQIFGELDIRSLCNAAMTCRSWNHAIDNNDCLWKNHCLTVRAVCQREIDCDRGNGYSWKVNLT